MGSGTGIEVVKIASSNQGFPNYHNDHSERQPYNWALDEGGVPMSHVNFKKKQCLVEWEIAMSHVTISINKKPMALSPKMALWGLTDKTKGAGGVNTNYKDM